MAEQSLSVYCGPTQIIASALMFRLFERAFRDLSPEGFFASRGLSPCPVPPEETGGGSVR
ncbi:MAG: hypothetical protein LBQ57_11595 [Spirochaetales bacterium]|nr:hypothetical protein [Spirochaetales bacterium]